MGCYLDLNWTIAAVTHGQALQVFFIGLALVKNKTLFFAKNVKNNLTHDQLTRKFWQNSHSI